MMKIICKNLTKTAALLFLLIFSVSAVFAQKIRTEDWFVADKQVDCVGVAPQKCLVVREAASADWKYFYSSIAGFNFREGYTQKIRVQMTPRQNVPADASALNYKLVRMLSRSKTDGNTLEEAKAQITNAKTGVLTGKTWTLTEINGTYSGFNRAYIEFTDKDKRFTARICNSIRGNYQQVGDDIEFSKFISTRMGCPESAHTVERNFMDAMVKVTRFEQTDDSLILYASDLAVLKLSAVAETTSTVKTLTNTKWVLTGIQGEKINPKSITPFLLFDKGKKAFSGNSSCNNIFGKYEADDSNLSFSGAGMTRMACLAPENQAIETGMVAALKNINRYEIRNSVLNLYQDDKVLLRLVALGQ